MVIIREVYPSLFKEISLKGVSIILGARQVGKTFLLKKLYSESISMRLKSSYFNLELPEDLRLFNASDEDIYNFLLSAGRVIFIDEFHYIKNASKIFKMLYDSGRNIKIYASGSSSLEIHKHLKESLAGRRWVTKLRPLSYNEFLQKFKSNSNKKKAFDEYMVYGGLPGLIHISDASSKMRLLSEMLESYIQKDIKSLIREENIRAFNSLLYLLAENQGSLISENSLSREVGLSAATINKHISLLENTYVCYPIYSYAKKLGNELKKSKKIYFYDLGIRNAILKDFKGYAFRDDKGVLAETFVFLQILSLIKQNMEIKFWRNKQGKEIDFIILKDRLPFIVEVKSSINSKQVPSVFYDFIKNYPETIGGMVVSEKFDGVEMINGKEIFFCRFENFLDKIKKKLKI
jgi:predicted AAA+ superfamily ATPase